MGMPIRTDQTNNAVILIKVINFQLSKPVGERYPYPALILEIYNSFLFE
jgi:hypothetical protein